MTDSEIINLPGSALAYLGDAVFELTVRHALLERGLTGPGNLNREALHYVTAVAQSRAAQKILPMLSPEEADVFRRGRNTGDLTPPKSATHGEYRRATGLEALFGYLYLKGEFTRIKQLFEAGFSESDCEVKNNGTGK
ncbi:MAG TPA: ribonuclease III domain-containing protein [Bacillota bacterium]|nr:ribonuclease III [Clostridiales bacterium]HPT84916.1 ribonuclease III domain-containing protein [Bacillota bacterium]